MDMMETGQRVRVIADRLVHYRQVGTIVRINELEGCYVHLDHDERPDAVIFFHVEELEPAPEVPFRQPQP